MANDRKDLLELAPKRDCNASHDAVVKSNMNNKNFFFLPILKVCICTNVLCCIRMGPVGISSVGWNGILNTEWVVCPCCRSVAAIPKKATAIESMLVSRTDASRVLKR